MKNIKILGMVLAFIIFVFPCVSYGEDFLFNITLQEFLNTYETHLEKVQEPILKELKSSDSYDRFYTKIYSYGPKTRCLILVSKTGNFVGSVIHLGKLDDTTPRNNHYIRASMMTLASVLNQSDDKFTEFIKKVLEHKRSHPTITKEFNDRGLVVKYEAQQNNSYNISLLATPPQANEHRDNTNPKQSAAIADKEKAFNITPDKFISEHYEGSRRIDSRVVPLKFTDLPEADLSGNGIKICHLDPKGAFFAIAFSKSSNKVTRIIHSEPRGSANTMHFGYMFGSLTLCSILLNIPQDEELAKFMMKVFEHKRSSPNTEKLFQFHDLTVFYTIDNKLDSTTLQISTSR